VFISYGKEDLAKAIRLKKDLSSCSFNTWLDEDDLLPGEVWDYVIPREVARSRWVVVLITRRTFKRQDAYRHKEIAVAVEAALRRPYNARYLIPCLLEKVTVDHPQLARLHFLKLYPSWKKGVEDLVAALSPRRKPRGGSPAASRRSRPKPQARRRASSSATDRGRDGKLRARVRQQPRADEQEQGFPRTQREGNAGTYTDVLSRSHEAGNVRKEVPEYWPTGDAASESKTNQRRASHAPVPDALIRRFLDQPLQQALAHHAGKKVGDDITVGDIKAVIERTRPCMVHEVDEGRGIVRSGTPSDSEPWPLLQEGGRQKVAPDGSEWYVKYEQTEFGRKLAERLRELVGWIYAP